jgi:hypothetical protein
MGTLAMSKSIGTRASALRRVAMILLLATITNGAEIDIETDKLIRHGGMEFRKAVS